MASEPSISNLIKNKQDQITDPREPKSLLQANITIDHRSQITEERERERRSKRERERERKTQKERQKRETKSERERKREK